MTKKTRDALNREIKAFHCRLPGTRQVFYNYVGDIGHINNVLDSCPRAFTDLFREVWATVNSMGHRTPCDFTITLVGVIRAWSKYHYSRNYSHDRPA